MLTQVQIEAIEELQQMVWFMNNNNDPSSSPISADEVSEKLALLIDILLGKSYVPFR